MAQNTAGKDQMGRDAATAAAAPLSLAADLTDPSSRRRVDAMRGLDFSASNQGKPVDLPDLYIFDANPLQ